MSIFRRLLNGSKKDPKTDPTSIGNLAIAKGYATEDQVRQAVEFQETKMPLGEILVERGILTESQLEELLLDQEVMRQRMTDLEASKFFFSRKREKMQEVTHGLQDVAQTLSCVAKGRR